MQTGLGKKLAEPSGALGQLSDAISDDSRVELEQLAVELAADHELSTGIGQGWNLQSRFQSDRTSLLHTYSTLFAALQRGEQLAPAADRFVKSFHLVNEQLEIISRRLTGRFYHGLPAIARGPLAGYPRIFAVASSFVSNINGDLNAATLSRFLHAYQTLNPLSIREIRGLDLTLRLVLVEKVKQLAHDEIVADLTSLATLDWHTLIQSVSVVDSILKEDPADVYASMDFVSQERYRQVIERLARQTGLSELEVARRAIELAATSTSEPEREHVGYYLIDDGLPALERTLNYRAGLGERFMRLVKRHSTAIYLKLILKRLIKPDARPRIDTSSGIPGSAITMIVIPAIFSSLTQVKELLTTIEAHYLSNQDRHIYFALLGDWKAAPQAELQDDDALLGVAMRGIEELNAWYNDGPHDRFHLFHRRRLWNASESDWEGWEKKRGKLHEFDRLLGGATDTSYTIATANPSFLKQVRFVLALDSDTELPRDGARKLIGTILHPLNRSQWDAMDQLRRGFAILQPLVSSRTAKADISQIPRLLSGYPGINPDTDPLEIVSANTWLSGRIQKESETNEEDVTLRVRLNARASWQLLGHGSDGLQSGSTRIQRLLVWSMAAHDLGAISRIGLLERMESILAEVSVAYSNETGVPPDILLSERGNLAAFLRALPHRCHELSLQPMFDKRVFDGLSDTLLLMKKAMTPRGEADAILNDISEEIENCLAYVRSERKADSRSTGNWARFLNLIQQRAAAMEVLLSSFTDQCPAINVEGLRLWMGEFSRQAKELHYDMQLFAPWTMVPTSQLEAIIRNHCPSLLDLWSHINRVLEPLPIIALRPERLAQLLPEVAQLRARLGTCLAEEREIALRRCDELTNAIERALRAAGDVKQRYEYLGQRCRWIEDAQTLNVFDEEYRLMRVQFQVNTGI